MRCIGSYFFKLKHYPLSLAGIRAVREDAERGEMHAPPP